MKNFYTLSIIILAGILTAGCAVNQGYLETSGLIDHEGAITMGGASYISLDQFCEQYELKCVVDKVSNVAELTKNQSSVKLMPDSNVTLINGAVRTFSPGTKSRDEEIYLPESLADYLLTSVFKPGPQEPYMEKPAIKRIVLDPGHGGRDPGAIGPRGLREKDVVLDVTKRLRDELIQRGAFEIVMTRDRDEFISLWKRSDIANKEKADLFISIHANAARSRKAKGFEVYFLSNATDDSARAIAAAENEAIMYEENGEQAKKPEHLDATIWDMQLSEFRDESQELAEFVCDTSSNELCLRNRGVKSARFYVLKGTRMPAILIEIGFISNREEEKKLRDSVFRQRVAGAIADGILKYNERFDKTEAFTKKAQ